MRALLQNDWPGIFYLSAAKQAGGEGWALRTGERDPEVWAEPPMRPRQREGWMFREMVMPHERSGPWKESSGKVACATDKRPCPLVSWALLKWSLIHPLMAHCVSSEKPVCEELLTMSEKTLNRMSERSTTRVYYVPGTLLSPFRCFPHTYPMWQVLWLSPLKSEAGYRR